MGQADGEAVKKYWVSNRSGHFYRKPGMLQVRMGATMKEARETYRRIRAGEIKLQRRISTPGSIERLKSAMFYSMQNRSTKKGSGMMSKEEFERLWSESRGRCAVTNMKFSMQAEKGKVKRPWAPSIDRLDVARGYEYDNCRLVCTAVNLAMNEWGEGVLHQIVRALAPLLDMTGNSQGLTESPRRRESRKQNQELTL